MAEKEMKSMEKGKTSGNKKINISIAPSHLIILVLLIAVIGLAYVIFTNPNALQQSLDRTSLQNAPVRKVTSEQDASQTVTDLGQNVKGLSSTLDEIDKSLG